MSRFGDLLGGKKAAPAPAPAPEPVVEETVEVAESPIVEEDTTNYEEVIEEEIAETFPYESDVSIKDMSKKELEEYGRTVGIELDRRHSKKRLVQELEEYLDNL
jgi:hypothetical protein